MEKELLLGNCLENLYGVSFDDVDKAIASTISSMEDRENR